MSKREKVVPLGYAPRQWQEECHRGVKRFSALALHRRAGKTEFAIIHTLSRAAKNTLPQPFYAYIAPFLKQAKLIAWERLKAYAMKIPGTVINETELWVKLPHNGAVIRIFGADNPDALRGVRLDGAVLDEVAQQKPEIWTEIVQPALSDRKGWAVFIGTPKGVNLFSDLMNQALSGKEDWVGFIYTVYDTDALPPDEVARLKRDMPDNEFRREYLCDFTAAGENQLISIADVEQACSRHAREDQWSWAPVIIGVDPARFGDDASCIAVRQGIKVHRVERHYGLDSVQLATKVANRINEFGAKACFIDSGMGTGVIDRLIHLGFDVTEVNFGSKASEPRYKNRRAEMWWKLREGVLQGLCLPPQDTMLKQDLATPTYEITDSNQIKIEDKDEIKKRLLRSPDSGDALALTYAEPVAADEFGGHHDVEPTQAQVSWDYDPFARKD